MYVVLSPFTWRASAFTVTVPRGFMTDGASIPDMLQGIFNPLGKYGQAAVLHDFLCEYLVVNVSNSLVDIGRRQADTIFCDAMRFLKVDAITRELMHEAVETYTTFLAPGTPSTYRAKRDAESHWSQENPLVLHT